MVIVRQPSLAAKRTALNATAAGCERLFDGRYNVDPSGSSRVIHMQTLQILEPSTLRQGGDS
jgi:hypothetical protein